MTRVLAHRGASRAQRENTVDAFRYAVALGVDGVEFDVRRTVDGALVVHHDAALDDGRVICQTAASDLPDYVPSLDAALDACGDLWVNVEIKNDPSDPDFDPSESVADATIAVLSAHDSDDRWLVSSFREETIARCRALRPSIPTAFLCLRAGTSTIERVAAAGHRALHPWVVPLTRRTVQNAHEVGLEVNTWTCDDPARMAKLVTWGVDAICTNVPDVAITVVKGTPA